MGAGAGLGLSLTLSGLALFQDHLWHSQLRGSRSAAETGPWPRGRCVVTWLCHVSAEVIGRQVVGARIGCSHYFTPDLPSLGTGTRSCVGALHLRQLT